MVKALTIGISVMAGILIGRIQIIENHDANDAIAASARAEKRADTAERQVLITRILLDKTEQQLLGMWKRLEPMLEEITRAETPMERHFAKQRIQTLRWEIDANSAVITAARDVDDRKVTRQAFVKDNFGGR